MNPNIDPKRMFPRIMMAIAGVMLLIATPVIIFLLYYSPQPVSPLVYVGYAFPFLIAIAMIYTAYKPNVNFIKTFGVSAIVLVLLFFAFNSSLGLALFASNPSSVVVFICSVGIFIYIFFLRKK